MAGVGRCEMPWFVFVCIFFFVLSFNIWVPIMLLHSESVSVDQRRTQLLLVWIVPVVGALVIASINQALDAPRSLGGAAQHRLMTDGEAIDLAAAARNNASHSGGNGGGD